MSDKTYVSWDVVKAKSKMIAADILTKYDTDKVNLIGVARGGMIPVTIIAHNLGLRFQRT